MMLDNLGVFAFIFSMLGALAMLVKYERPLKRWLMKSPRRRKKKTKAVSLQYTMLRR